MMFENGQQTAKQACVIDGKMVRNAAFNRLVLNHRPQDFTGLLNIDGRRRFCFVGQQELVYGHGCVNVGVGRTQGVEGGLKGVEVR